MASKTSRATNVSEQEKLLLAELGRDFPEVEIRGYDEKTLGKKGKGMRENFNLIQLPKTHFVKRGDLCQLQECRGQLKL